MSVQVEATPFFHSQPSESDRQVIESLLAEFDGSSAEESIEIAHSFTACVRDVRTFGRIEPETMEDAVLLQTRLEENEIDRAGVTP